MLAQETIWPFKCIYHEKNIIPKLPCEQETVWIISNRDTMIFIKGREKNKKNRSNKYKKMQERYFTT